MVVFAGQVSVRSNRQGELELDWPHQRNRSPITAHRSIKSDVLGRPDGHQATLVSFIV